MSIFNVHWIGHTAETNTEEDAQQIAEQVQQHLDNRVEQYMAGKDDMEIEEFLTVDGTLSPEAGPYIVKLSE